MTDELLNQIEQLANAVVIRTADAEVAVVPVLVAEVKRLRAILAALREPSESVKQEIADLSEAILIPQIALLSALRAAVKTAEGEVNA